MSADYTIAAIPTLYRGRLYRSRLEARWAAFFDLLNWRHEYEPFDLGKWSPDFRLPRIGGPDIGESVLVEVKPIDAFDDAISSRMVSALEKSGRWNEETFLLLTRVAPKPIFLGRFCDPESYETYLNIAVSIGWMGQICIDNRPMTAFWHEAFVVWTNDDDRPQFVADIGLIDPAPAGCHPSWSGVLSGASAYSNMSSGMSHPAFYPHYTIRKWSDATNAVQYHPGART